MKKEVYVSKESGTSTPSKKKKLAEYSHGHITWYATEKGVEREDKKLGFGAISFLPYKHITSISLQEENIKLIGYLGIIIVILFFVIEKPSNDIIILIRYILLGIAVLLILSGFLIKKIQYTFTGADIDKKLWNMRVHGFVHQSEIENFISRVRKML